MRVLLSAALIVASAGVAVAQGGFSPRPQGYPGVGHAEHHEKYIGLTNKRGASCCSGIDCRPTQARWNATANTWEAMVNGQWQLVTDGDVILDDAWLQQLGRPRWDSQAHVCAALKGNADGTHRIYCLIPSESGQ